MGRESVRMLCKDVLPSLAGTNIILPAASVWQLPEKVLQFGTGVLLRGLPDYYINKANNKGIFNGRVVVVKSTGKGSSDAFAAQDNLYTHCIKGIGTEGTVTEESVINASISRVINASDQWEEVIALAANPHLQVVVSNTTEVGIVLDETDSSQASPPRSFPGKLLAFLLARYRAFEGSRESGLVIVPTELIVDNGKVLKEIVHRLAQLNHLEAAFINWLLDANDWCSSLVDRIVPGALPEADKKKLEELYNYTDELAIMSEPYGLWAIETRRESTKQVLSFCEADSGVIITQDIRKYRELKLRLLNATHSFCCGFAFLSGFNLVNEAMRNEAFQRFIHQLMYREISPCLTAGGISGEEAEAFAGAVLKRFANPFIHHQWLSISLQYTGKMKARCVPLMRRYYQQFQSLPTGMLIGFAAYLVFMKSVTERDGKYYGDRNGSLYPIQDDAAALFYNAWQTEDTEEAWQPFLYNHLFGNDDRAALFPLTAKITAYVKQLVAGALPQQLLNDMML